MQSWLLRFPLRRLLTVPFLVLLLASNLVIGTVFVVAAYRAVIRSVDVVQDQVESQIRLHLDTYLDSAVFLNRINRTLYEREILNVTRESGRDRYFSGQLREYPDFAMSFLGRPDGSFYGARRTAAGGIEVVRNNASTGGASRYYATSDEGDALAFVVEFPGFDPRVRPWYTGAVERGASGFSPLYRHFVFDDLAITASAPLFDERGEVEAVFGVDLLLDQINHFLQGILVDEDALLIVVERDSGAVVANSLLARSFDTNDDGQLVRLLPTDLPDPVPAIWASISGDVGGPMFARGFIARTVPYSNLNLDWSIVVAIPQAKYLGPVFRIARTVAISVLAFLIVVFFATTRVVSDVLGPLKSLTVAADKVSRGEWDVAIEPRGTNEIAGLARAFVTMSDEIGGLVAGLEDRVRERTAELEEANQTKEKFLAIIAHDLRGPLGAVHSLIRHVAEDRDTLDPGEEEETLDALVTSSGAVLDLLENLLLWARSRQDGLPFSPTLFDLGALVTETNVAMSRWIQEKGLGFEYDSNSVFVLGDRDMIMTVYRNLLSNAIKYTPRGGRIRAGLESRDGACEVSVTDDGIGMSPDLIDGLTRIDVRSSRRGTAGESGSGLGLVLASDFLARHGSKFVVQSQPDQGSRFSFVLPVADNPSKTRI